MKKRVLSALLVLCMACGLVSTAWAADGQATRETAEKPGIMLLNAEDVDQQTASDSAATPAPTAEPTAEPSATPNATEAPEATATPAPENSENADAEPTATPSATPDTTAGEAEPVEYTAVLEQDGQALNVVVTAPADAFGEDVQPTLNVTAIEDETQAADIEAKLTENNIEYDGFVALDIHFTDADGNEIEPAEPVTVRIELPDSIIDSGIDLNTLAVQHFAEDEAGNVTSVDQVASVADGTIALSDEAKAAMEAQAAENAADPESTEEAGPAHMMLAPAANNALTPDNGEEETEAPVVAEFEVNGFSSFTITWNDYANNTSTSVEVVLWDAVEDEELPYSGNIGQFNEQLQSNGEVTFTSTTVPQIEGYTFDHAEYGWDYSGYWNGSAVTTITAENQRYWSPGFFGLGAGWRNNWVYKIDGQEINGTPTIRLFYTPEGGSENPGQTVTPEPGHEKTVTWNATDNAYDLTLTVNGTVGSETTPVPVDVLMIVDQSNSMDGSKLTNTKLAMLALIDSLEAQNNVDTRYSIVGFSSKYNSLSGNGTADDARILSTGTNNGWVSANRAKNVIGTKSTDWNGNPTVNGGFDVSGGTNYQAGLRLGKTQLDKSREDATTVVIFLSDGDPTYYIGGGDGQNSLNRQGNGWKATKTEAGTIRCDTFYSIRIGDADEAYLTDIRDSVNVPQDQRHYVSANDDGSNLTGFFEDIAEDATKALNVTHVKITDTLSDYVEPVLGNDGQPAKLDVVIIDNDSDQKVDNTFGISANYNSDTKELTLNFPEGYPLNSNYTYKVVMSILPNGTAELYYAQNGSYLPGMIGQEGTGDHANSGGFYSNDGPAKLTYRYPNDMEDRTADYKMPVVQVKKSYLVLSKALGEGTEAGSAQEFTFEIAIPANAAGTYGAKYTNDESNTEIIFAQKPGETNATATVTLAANEQVYIALPTDTQVTIKETSVDGFTQTWYQGQSEEPLTPASDGSIEATLSTTAGQSTNITCVNTAEVVTCNLTITKNLVDKDGKPLTVPGEEGKTFTFTVTAEGDLAEKVSDGEYFAEDAQEGSAAVLEFDQMTGTPAGTENPDGTTSTKDTRRTTGTLSVTVNAGASSASITVADLPIGTYTIAENTTADSLPSITDYTWSDVAYGSDYTVDNASVTIEKDELGTLAVNNKYEHNNVVLTINKQICGLMGDTDSTEQFDFKLTLSDSATGASVNKGLY